MQIDGHIQALREDLARVASLGDEATAHVAEILSSAIESSLARRLQDILAEAALELNTQLDSGHVEVRVAGREPELVYVRDDGSAPEGFTCPFHGFSWKKDGTYQGNPCDWDFEHLNPAEMRLPEAEVAHWGGYIFIREERGGPSLEEFLAPLPDHFKQWKHEECATVIWVAKVELPPKLNFTVSPG